ncbi:CHAT domain-containing protein [Kitasatospora sp. NPDC058170]|uniref:CHAT domain-containing protein n=1 Tax=Kitasatospora sp. NPDC058170 TaxID=3346364 RepID=UPI0036DD1BC0
MAIPGTDGAATSWQETEIVCGRCSVRTTARLRRFLHFPGDARTVLDLVTGRLNVHRCPVCGAGTRVRTPVVVVVGDGSELAVGALPQRYLPRLAEQARLADGTLPLVVGHDSVEQLADAVRGRADALLARALREYTDGELPGYRDERVPLLLTPLALLLAEYQLSSGITAPGEGAGEAAERVARVTRLFTACVVELVDRSFTYAFHHGGIATLPQVLEHRVPVECLRPEVLAALAERCPAVGPESLTDPSEVDRIHRYEYLNSLAHALAGRPNPRAEVWASLCFTLFALSRTPGIVVDPAALLTPEVLRRTITFPAAWNAAMPGWRDSETHRHFAAWFEHVGAAERFRDEMAGGLPFRLAALDKDDASLTATMLDMVLADDETDETDETDGSDGPGLLLAGACCRSLVAAGRVAAAEQFAWTLCHRLAAAGRGEELGWTVVRIAPAFAEVWELRLVRRLLERFRPRVLRGGPSPALRSALENERGNVLRYEGRLEEALAAYESSQAAAATATDGVTPYQRRILRTNRAIVLRDLGRVDVAVALLTEAIAQEPPDSVARVGYSVSLAECHLAVNRREAALAVVRAAAAVPLSPNHVGDRVRIRTRLAELRAAVEEEPVLDELQQAWELSAGLRGPRAVAAGAILHCATRATVAEHLVASAQEFLTDLVGAGSANPLAVLRLSQYHRERGELDAARAAMAAVEPLMGVVGLPWQFPWQRFLLVDPADPAKRWSAARLVLDALDDRIVQAPGDPDLVGSWLVDKEEVQRELVACLTEAESRGVAAPGEYLRVFEFVNGREVRSRHAPPPTARPGRSTVDRTAALLERSRQSGVTAALAAFVETPDGLRVVTAGSDGVVRSVPLGVGLPELRSLSAAFDRSAGPGCVTARQQRRALAPLEDFLRRLGETVAEQTGEGEHVVLLPSSELLGFPLHAATLSGGRLLLERNGLSYGPNLEVVESVLAAGALPAPGGHPAAVLSVPKERDRQDFGDRLRGAAGRLADLLGPGASRLDGTAVTKAACLELLPRVRHLLLLAHGANSLPAHGRGVCVSDGSALPPAPLPVEQAAELRRFLLDAADLVTAPACPDVVVSIACSSGRSRPGAGGTRIGLERALFAGGTRALVAPLWDVDQASALAFVEALYAHWTAAPGRPLARHYRAALLETRARFEHPFHWAPFALKGSWL